MKNQLSKIESKFLKPTQAPSSAQQADIAERDTKMKAFMAEIGDMLTNLYCRWQDEKQYEDINDYAKPFQAAFEKHNLTLIKMTKSPFGFQAKLGTAVVQVFHKATSRGWQRIK